MPDGATSPVLLLLADVADFSLLGDVGRDAVRWLQECLGAWKLGDSSTLLGFGDAVLLVVATEKPSRIAEKFLDQAITLARDARARFGVDLRLALHAATFSLPLGSMAAGQGVSRTAWCAALARRNQCLATDAFTRLLPRGRAKDVVPELGGPPIEVSYKAGKTARLRVVRHAELDAALPQRVLVQQEAHRLLRQQISDIYEVFIEYMVRLAPDLRMEDAQPRVTLWRRHGDALVSMHGRRAWLPSDERPSRVRWRLSPPQGPLASCLARGRPELLLDLPDASRSWSFYEAAWRERNVSAEMLLGFNRHARSIIAVPARFGGLADYEVAICIDLLVPLAELEPGLHAAALSIQVSHGPYIGALVAVREA